MFHSMVFLFTVMLCVLVRNHRCFVIPQHDSDLAEKEPSSYDDVIQSIMASLSPRQLAEDDALLKTIVHDATRDDDEDDDELATETEAMFLTTILHLLEGGELYRDARIDAITAALRSAFLETTGKVDHEYIEKVLAAIKEKDEQNRRLEEEHQTNVFRSVPSEDQELLDGGFSLPPTPSSAAGKQ